MRKGKGKEGKGKEERIKGWERGKMKGVGERENERGGREGK